VVAPLQRPQRRAFRPFPQSPPEREVGRSNRPGRVAELPVMAAAPLAALDMPLKVLIWADDGQTKVTYTAPTALAARYGLSQELAARLAGIDGLTDSLVDA
jgi:Domain of unknown function DUF302